MKHDIESRPDPNDFTELQLMEFYEKAIDKVKIKNIPISRSRDCGHAVGTPDSWDLTIPSDLPFQAFGN